MFTCHYCGKKAPDIVLELDHVQPVATGGDNDILNLVTSCFDCNRGKGKHELSDNAVIKTQREQLELLQERREQIGLMFEWKKSLSKQDEETFKMIIDYLEAKITPLSVNENGKASIRDLLRRFGINPLLDAIDVAAGIYIKFAEDGSPTTESVENFLNKLGGVLYNKSLKPIDQKLSLIKNKARRAFNYYDNRRGAILLNQYVKALRENWHYSDEKILEDLEQELIPMLDEQGNWSGWKAQLETWIGNVKEPKEEKTSNEFADLFPEHPKDSTPERLESLMHGRKYTLDGLVPAMVHILKPFPNFDEEKIKTAIYQTLIGFIEGVAKTSPEDVKKYYDTDEGLRQTLAYDVAQDKGLRYFTDYEGILFEEKLDTLLLENLDDLFMSTLYKACDEFYLLRSMFSLDDIQKLDQMSLEYLKELIAEKQPVT